MKDSFGAPEVRDRALKPPGILPRNAQARVLGGIAVLMLAIIVFSGKSAPKDKKTLPAPPAVDPNQARIQEYRARIDEQARKLALEQAELAQTKHVLTAPTGAAPAGAPAGAPARVGVEDLRRTTDPVERSWVDVDREKRAYQSLYASNIALSYRNELSQESRTAPLDPVPPVRPNRLADGGKSPSTDSLLGNTHSRGEFKPEQAVDRPEPQGEDASPTDPSPLFRLLEGTIIETVLTNRLDGHFSGPVNCMVTSNVYSRDPQRLLVPQGSRVLGQVRKVDTFGQQRLAVVFHRLLLPNGSAISLEGFQGLNAFGETGLRDKVNHHYLQVFGVLLAVGAIAGLAQADTGYGLNRSAADAYRQGVTNSLSQSSLNILDRYLNVLPTFTIREGHRVKVYLSSDLLLPAYEKGDL